MRLEAVSHHLPGRWPSDSQLWQPGSVPATVISAWLPVTFRAQGRNAQFLESIVPVQWHGTSRPSSANRRRTRTLIVGKLTQISS